jgi:hypothetical protein
MNCELCRENISQFLDCELEDAAAEAVRRHLVNCAECAKIFADFSAILATCNDPEFSRSVPPNPRALWCRINNVIESESKPPAIDLSARRGWFSNGVRFTFSQAGLAILGVAVISSLLTIVGIRNYFEPSAADFTTRTGDSQTTFEKVFSNLGLIETPQQARVRRLQEQQAAIDYWNRRVQLRRAQWDSKMRDAFDRNLIELDQAVHDYTMILERDPSDELSGEMLDAALNDKMNLLRQFSEL